MSTNKQGILDLGTSRTPHEDPIVGWGVGYRSLGKWKRQYLDHFTYPIQPLTKTRARDTMRDFVDEGTDAGVYAIHQSGKWDMVEYLTPHEKD